MSTTASKRSSSLPGGEGGREGEKSGEGGSEGEKSGGWMRGWMGGCDLEGNEREGVLEGVLVCVKADERARELIDRVCGRWYLRRRPWRELPGIRPRARLGPASPSTHSPDREGAEKRKER